MKSRSGMAVIGAIGLLVAAQGARANNIAVTNATLYGQDLSGQYVFVDFNLGWENSWRTSDGDRDAAWVFVKYLPAGSNAWQHATLSSVSSNHIPALGSAVSAVADGKGVFVYRATPGTGSASYQHLRLRWNYGTDGYAFTSGSQVAISVHAIEMVYVPTEPFYLGGVGSEPNHYYQYTDGTQTTNAYLVTSEAAITIGSAPGNLVDYFTPNATLPAAFPKGYNAFYCMKYEMSQGQYADFLNKLTGLQWTNRSGVISSYGNARRTIHGTYGNCLADAPDRGLQDISYADTCAYLAWAGLRPMTELEFEKACRGPAQPVPDEFAWGTPTAVYMTAEAGTAGSGTETPSPANANIYGWALGGSIRCGVFARAGSTREQAGASYYGIMELSGSIWERCITTGTAAGRSFQGTHGSGVLNADGTAANTTDWSGCGIRGCGGMDVAYPYMPETACRSWAAYSASQWGGYSHNARGVRTAP